jgi:AGCS family alanine or glycine:cation symporter
LEAITNLVGAINAVVWGPVMLALILGTGLWLSIGLRAMPVRNIGRAFRLLFAGRAEGTAPGDITPFQALMTSLAATVGTGNIAGVATAIALGGPGALAWMWVTALVGMATKYAEAVCAVTYRELDSLSRYSGGPMYYIRGGLGPRWAPLATAFAVFGAVAGFGIGNTVQSNSVADALASSLAIPEHWTAAGLFVLAAAVVLGARPRRWSRSWPWPTWPPAPTCSSPMPPRYRGRWR